MSRNFNVTIAVIVAVAMFAVPAVAAFDGACSSTDAAAKAGSAEVLLGVVNGTGGETFDAQYDTGWTFGSDVTSLSTMGSVPYVMYEGESKPAYSSTTDSATAYLVGGAATKDTLTSTMDVGTSVSRLLTINDGCTVYLGNVILERGSCPVAMVNVMGNLVIGAGVVIDGSGGNNISLMTTDNGTITIDGNGLTILGGIGEHNGTEASGVTISGNNVTISGDIKGSVTITGSNAKITGDIKGSVTINGSNAKITGDVGHAVVNGSAASITGTVSSAVVNTGGSLNVTGTVGSLELKGGSAEADSVGTLTVDRDCAHTGDVDNLVVLSGTVTFTGDATNLHISGGIAKVKGTIGKVEATGGSQLIGQSADERCTVNKGIAVNIDGEGTFALGDVTVDTAGESRGMTVNKGDVEINDGSLFQNNAVNNDDGGAILLCAGATLTMNGGMITGNSATNASGEAKGNGGAIAVYNGSTFIMKGGEITGNTASVTSEARNSGNGGAVYVAGTFTMESGKITRNTALNGGAVRINSAPGIATFTMTGGEISGNQANDNGGAVSVRHHNDNVATFTVDGSDVMITGNRAGLNETGESTMTDEGYGGAVHLFNADSTSVGDLGGSVMNFLKGTISGNTALKDGSAIALKDNAAKLSLEAGVFGEGSTIYISRDIPGEHEATIDVYNNFSSSVRINNSAGSFDLIGTGSDRDRDAKPDVSINGLTAPEDTDKFMAGDEKALVTCLNGTETVSTHEVYVDTPFSEFLGALSDTEANRFVGWVFGDGSEVTGNVQEAVEVHASWEAIQQTTGPVIIPRSVAVQTPAPQIVSEPVLNAQAMTKFVVTMDGVERSVDSGTVLKVEGGTPPEEGMILSGWNVDGVFVPAGKTAYVAGDSEISSVWLEPQSTEEGTGGSGVGTDSSSISGMDGVLKTMVMLLLVIGGLYVVKRELA